MTYCRCLFQGKIWYFNSQGLWVQLNDIITGKMMHKRMQLINIKMKFHKSFNSDTLSGISTMNTLPCSVIKQPELWQELTLSLRRGYKWMKSEKWILIYKTTQLKVLKNASISNSIFLRKSTVRLPLTSVPSIQLKSVQTK